MPAREHFQQIHNLIEKIENSQMDALTRYRGENCRIDRAGRHPSPIRQRAFPYHR